MLEATGTLVGFACCLLWLVAGARLLLASSDTRSRPDFVVGLCLLLGGLLTGLATAPFGGVSVYPVEALLLGGGLLWCYGVAAGDEATGLEAGDRLLPLVVLGAAAFALQWIAPALTPQPIVWIGIAIHPFDPPIAALCVFVWWRTRTLPAGYFQCLGADLARLLALCAAGACLLDTFPTPLSPTVRFGLLALAPGWFVVRELRRATNAVPQIAAVAVVVTFALHASADVRGVGARQRWVERLTGQIGQTAVAHHRASQAVESAFRTRAVDEPKAMHEKRAAALDLLRSDLRATIGTADDAMARAKDAFDEAIESQRRAARQVFDALSVRAIAWSDEQASNDAETRVRDGYEQFRVAHERGVLALQALQDGASVMLGRDAASSARFERAFLILAAAVALIGSVMLARRKAKAALPPAEVLPEISHQLRGPVQSVVGYAELMRDTEPGAPSAPRFVDAILQSAQRLETLLDELVAYGQCEEGEVEIGDGDYLLDEVLRDALGTVRTRAERKGLLLTCEIGPDVPRELLGDGLRVRQIVRTLLGNAVEWTRRGCVSLLAERDGRSLCLHVRDTSPGLTTDEQRTLFTPFRDRGARSRAKGATLGLAVAAGVAEALGGRLTAASNVGRGSVLTLRLPLRVSPQARHLPSGLLRDDA